MEAVPAHDSIHGLCKRCMKDYVEYVTKGAVYVIPASVKSVNDVTLENIVCAVPGCGKTIGWENINKLYSEVEQRTLKERALLQAHLTDEEEKKKQDAFQKLEVALAKKGATTTIPGTCWVRGCTSPRETLSRSSNCLPTCSVFICATHQKQFEAHIRPNKSSHVEVLRA